MNDQATITGQRSTDLALDRTLLAKERTFAAVIRTALSFVGFGIGVAILLPDLQPAWLVQTLGILLIVGGGFISLFGFRTVHDVITKLHEEGVKEPRWIVSMTSLLLLVTAILALLVVGLP